MSFALFMCCVAVLAAPALSQSTTCTGGRVYSACGSPCNITCANHQNPPICLTACAAGCFCPQGTVLHNDQCVDPSQCSAPVTNPPVPSCTNGKIFNTCGTACPLTCDNHLNPPLRCTLQCVIGCFCPHGTVELGNTCVPPTSCPNAVTAPPTTPPPTPTCTNGKIFNTCGTACPRTCDNYQQEFIPCTRHCVIGCFCPEGMVEMGETCVPPSQCPGALTTTESAVTVATVPPQPTCTNGKIFETCGTACPLTCDNYRNPPFVCPAVCVVGCFCPRGLVELGNICVPPTGCPDAVTAPLTTRPPTPTCTNGKIFNTCGTACPRTCDNNQQWPVPCTRQCVIGCFCPEGMVEMGETCVPPSQCQAVTTTLAPPVEPACTNGKVFETCGTACPLTCDNYLNPPTGCIDECVEGCFCPRRSVQLGDTCVSPTSCPNKTCPTGMEYRECGPLCPYTCDSFFGRNPCFSLRCAPAGCYCPENYVMADGQCTPAQVACQDTKPTTVVNPSPVRLEVKIRNTPLDEFMNQQGIFLTSVKNLLSNHGYGNVQANVHSITQDEHLVVVIQLNGDSISAAQAQELASLLSDQSSALTLEIVEVTVSDSGSDSDDDGALLSSPAIIGIAVGASVLGLVLIILLSAVLVVCVVSRNGQTCRQEKYRSGTELESVSAPHEDFTKDKLVRESLSY